MIEILPGSEGKVMGMRAKEKLTDDDYKTVLIPQLLQLIKKYGRARLLMYLGKGFDCWELGAMWDDATFGIKHRKDFEKICVVGGPKWVEWGTRLVKYVMKDCEVRTFGDEELAEAWKWVKT